jgi:cytoskeletal protein CcmA (bactofilin family)
MKKRNSIISIRIPALVKFVVRAFGVTLLMAPLSGRSQNVGIGTNNPQAPLHVVGSILSNHIEVLSTATVNTRMAINSPVDAGYRLYVNNGHTYLGGNLEVSNDGIIGNNFRVNGRIGINGATNGSFGLYVNNSNSYFQGNITTTGTATIGGAVQATGNLHAGNNLTVANDGIIENNFRVNGRVGINGATNASYGLFVNNSNSYFQGNTITTGNATIQGNAAVQGDLTINGNGSVRSAGPSQLRMGFVTFNINFNFVTGQHNHEFIVPITPFEGTANDVKVMIAQFIPEPGPEHLNWFRVKMAVGPVSAANDNVVIRMTNDHSGGWHFKGTLHLLVVARDI